MDNGSRDADGLREFVFIVECNRMFMESSIDSSIMRSKCAGKMEWSWRWFANRSASGLCKPLMCMFIVAVGSPGALPL
jgi:hypothetical protein